MKEYLVQYDVNGIRYESFVSKNRLNELKEKSQLVYFRKLTPSELMELLEYSMA